MQFSFAQEKTVTGVVSDAIGPIPGANVVVKGTSRGVQTDVDGKFSIKANTGDVLIFSFVGMTETAVTVGASNAVNVKMQEGVVLGEVVVTAYGIKRAPKELAYATKKIETKELVQAAPINAVTALAGKVSGLNIITKNNGVNPSTGIVLRGYKSITGSSSALIVIDGVVQASTALNNLNPNDIASVNVLKSGNATVLFGSEGSNGALIVTTKQGSKNSKLDIQYNSSYTVEQIKYFPELQTTFGPGFNNQYDPIENTNWGPRFDGVPRRLGPILADGTYQVAPYSAVKNGRQDFFVDGVTLINGISMSGGDEKSTIYFSAQRTDVKGITPRDEYTKDNFRLNASRTHGNLKVSANISYYSDKTDVVGNGGYQNRPLFWSVLNTAANVNLTDYKDWTNNPFATPEGYYNEYYQNPYMIVDIARNTSKANRLVGNARLDYQFTDWLSASYSLTTTNFNRNIRNTRAAVTYNPVLAPRRAANNTPASVADQYSGNNRINSDFLLKFDKELTENLKLNVVLGNRVSTYDETRVTVAANNLLIPGLYDPSVRTGELSNGSEAIYDLDASGNRNLKRRKVGYFADVNLGISKFLFLNGSYATDKSSTLGSSWYDFYGFGASLSLTDAIPSIKGDVLSFAKLSASYSKTGNGDTPTVGWTNELFSTPAGFPYGSTAGFALPLYSVNANITPEFTTNKEFGVELEFLKSRVKLGATYFISNATDQFLSAGTSTASGANIYRTNSGELQNKGLELDLNLTPIKTQNFEWNLGVNMSKIESEILSLSDGSDKVQVGLAAGDGAVGIYAQVGASYPSLFGTAYTRDDQGRVIIDADGNPVVSSELKNLGSTTPDLILGFNSSVRYKNLTLSAVADYKTGHVYYNNLVDALEFTGSTQHSVSAGRLPFVFPNSSYEDPNNPGTYISNTNVTTSDGGYEFWNGSYNAIKENYVVDASTFKLREVSLVYDFPAEMLPKNFVKGVSFGIIARNVLMLRSAQNKYTDPEFTTDGQQVTGFGTQSQLPPTGSYGFKLDVKF
jgi:TonB-linked SusC/RagA family outer membrane protein